MTEKLKNYFGDEKEKRKLIITYCVTLIVFLLVFFFAPEDIQESGALTTLPAVFLLIFIFYTKRILEGLILGTVLSYFMIHKGDSVYPVLESIQITLQSETFSWYAARLAESSPCFSTSEPPRPFPIL